MTDGSQKEFVNHKYRKLKPEGIIPRSSMRASEIDMLMLSFALIFNDIKGIVFFDRWRVDYYRTPGNNEVSVHSGEYGGLRIQVIKYFSGILFEALNLIEAHKALIKSDAFRSFERGLSKDNKEIWELLLDVANVQTVKTYNEESVKRFKKLLLMIRNKAAFHYDQSGKHLAQGFRRHFYETDHGDATKFAFYSSLQTDFDKTRYYYADAALSGFITEELEQLGNPADILREIYRLGIQVAKVIAGILEEYHHTKPQA